MQVGDAPDRPQGVARDVAALAPLVAGHPSAIVTPHMAFHSLETQAELQRRASAEVARARRGGPARSPLNTPRTLVAR